MKKYLAVAKVFYKAQISWRADIALNLVFSVTKILFAYILWGAIFEGRQEVAGFTFHAMLTYYIVSSFFTQMDATGDVVSELARHIRGGTFSKYMILPVSVQGYFGAQTAGKAAFFFGFQLVAVFAWKILFGVQWTLTANPALWLCAVLLWIMGSVCMVQLNFLLGILAFKWGEIWLFSMVKDNLVRLVAGALVPLALLPAGIVAALRLLPFYPATYLPTMLLLGRNAEEFLPGLCVLTIWTLALWGSVRVLYQRLRVRYDGVGV